jgi:transposase
VHPVAADVRNVLARSLTAGQAGDAPQGRQLIQALSPHHGAGVVLLMDSAYQDNATRRLTLGLGLTPVVPPNPQRSRPWEYDQKLYCRRNPIERLFRRIKGWRRVFTRYNKLDMMFAAFITGALIAKVLRWW